MSDEVKRAAVGRVASIGDFYNMTTDSFLHDTLFKSRLEARFINTVELYAGSTELFISDTIQEKCDAIDIEAELQLSLLSGMVKPKGSGSYVTEKRKSNSVQHLNLVYRLKTVKEDIKIRQNIGKINPDVISMLTEKRTAATHVVVGIEWGAGCLITYEDDNEDNKDTQKVQGNMRTELAKIKALLDTKGTGNLSYQDKGNDERKHFTFKCKTDVSDDTNLPVTFEEAVEQAKRFPSKVKQINEGKGVPLKYFMMPVETVLKICEPTMEYDIRYNKIKDSIVNECVQIIEKMTSQRQTLRAIQENIHANQEYVCNNSIQTVDRMCDQISRETMIFTDNFQEKVKRVRSGHDDVSVLRVILGKQSRSILKYDDAIKELQTDASTIHTIKSWQERGINYLGKKSPQRVEYKSTAIVLYQMEDTGGVARGWSACSNWIILFALSLFLSWFLCLFKSLVGFLWGFVSSGPSIVRIPATPLTDTTGSRTPASQGLFLRLQEMHANDDYEFFVVHKELRNDLWPSYLERTTVMSFVSGTTNCCIDLLAEVNMNLIYFDTSTNYESLPMNRVPVSLRCPKSFAADEHYRCSNENVTWKCSKCKESVEMGKQDQQFYCKCGTSDPYKARFRCSENKNHGMNFDKYSHDNLHSQLKQITGAMKEINILILGETGVGKSTWINSFHNYLLFTDLTEASNSDQFHVLIPSRFTFMDTDEDEEMEKTIHVGTADDNEVTEVGKSATREPRSYVFPKGTLIVTLIDTPGIGDVDGVQQDFRNLDNILAFISKYDEIHAVCILLKPNNARLTTTFRFCIQELLAQLHSSAKDNVVFCFTNARGTMYRPGDTLPALKRMLKAKDIDICTTSRNYFCFDNESFRFLALLKNGVKFDSSEESVYSESWKKSVKETERLLEHILTLPAHKVTNTVSMNEARKIIVAISKPLAKAATTIQQSVDTANEIKLTIDLAKQDMQKLKEELSFDGYGLEYTHLGYPRTVCADSKCVRYVPVGESRNQNTVYEQTCHDHCGLQGIPTETTNDYGLERCWAMNGQTHCRHEKCGHHFLKHMHLTYDIKVVAKTFLSPEVQKQIQQKGNLTAAKEFAKQEIGRKIDELKDEERRIINASAKFGSFLKATALIPYNDAVGDYLDMCIEHEKKKEKKDRRGPFLDKLREMKAVYERQRKILDKAIKTGKGENIRTPEEVFDLLQELFHLKHNGPTLKNLFQRISIAASSRNKQTVKSIGLAPVTSKPPVPQKSRRGFWSWVGSWVPWGKSKTPKGTAV